MNIISGLAKHKPARHAGKGRDATETIGANGQRLSGVPPESRSKALVSDAACQNRKCT
jgi:hypothetical protein